jgi:hypothetical protein
VTSWSRFLVMSMSRFLVMPSVPTLKATCTFKAVHVDLGKAQGDLLEISNSSGCLNGREMVLNRVLLDNFFPCRQILGEGHLKGPKVGHRDHVSRIFESISADARSWPSSRIICDFDIVYNCPQSTRRTQNCISIKT